MATSYTTDPIEVIDVDSHYSPPPGFWEAYAPAKFKERVPRIGEDAEGMPEWVVDGQSFDSIGFNMVRPDGTKAPGNMRALPFFEQVHPGSYDVKARVAWLDDHGISRQIMYPNTGGFSSQMFFTKIADEELRNVCMRTYNDAAAALQEGDQETLRRVWARFLLQQRQVPSYLYHHVAQAYLELGDSYRQDADAGARAARQKELKDAAAQLRGEAVSRKGGK